MQSVSTFANRLLPVAVAIALLCCLAACGGGSSSSGPTTPSYANADFVGTYQLVCLGGSRASADTSATYGFITADGMGELAGMVGENLNGTASPLSATGNIPYLVQPDGTLLTDNLAGYLACDGDCAVLATTEDGQDPMICLLIRREGIYDDSLLSGNYHLGGLAPSGRRRRADGPPPAWAWGSSPSTASARARSPRWS